MSGMWITERWTGIALLVAFLVLPSLSWGAEVSATALAPSISVGGSTQIEIRLDLGVGELASIFQGHFDLVGFGSVIEAVTPADLTAGGPSWGTTAGGIVGSQAQVSMTSSNAGGSRLVATLIIQGMSAGTFELELAAGSFAQRDLDVFPFFEDVPLGTPIGSALVTVTVTEAAEPVPALKRYGLLILVAALLQTAVLAHRAFDVTAR